MLPEERVPSLGEGVGAMYCDHIVAPMSASHVLMSKELRNTTENSLSNLHTATNSLNRSVSLL